MCDVMFKNGISKGVTAYVKSLPMDWGQQCEILIVAMNTNVDGNITIC